MIELFDVRALATDGSTTLAHTTVLANGHVLVRVRPELLEAHEAVARHLGEVGERLDQQLRRLRIIDRGLWVVRRGAEAAAVLMVAQCAWQTVQQDVHEALAWGAWTLASLLARWLVPRLIVRLGRRWLAGKLRRMREDQAAQAVSP